MEIIRRRRKELRLSIRKLAETCQIDHQRIAELELGSWLPLPKVSNVVAQALNLAVPSVEQMLRSRDVARLARCRPFELEVHNSEAWTRAARRHSKLFHQLEPDYSLWLRTFVLSNSIDECVFWVLQALAGARRRLLNPHHAGFRHLAIVDSAGQLLGERHLPCLEVHLPGCVYLIWPQPNLRTDACTLRPDALVLRCTGPRTFLVVECDGVGHNSEKDDFRRKHLRLPEIRFTPHALDRSNFCEWFAAQIRDAPSLPPKFV